MVDMPVQPLMQHLGLLDGAEAADSLVVDLERWTARRPSSHTRRVYPDSLCYRNRTLPTPITLTSGLVTSLLNLLEIQRGSFAGLPDVNRTYWITK